VVVDLVRFCCFFEDMIGKESGRGERELQEIVS